MESWASYRKRPNIQFLESRGAGHRASGGLGQSDADHAPPPQALLATAAPHWDSHPRPPQRFWDTREATCASFTAGVKFTVAFRCLETGKVSDRD